MPQLFGDRADAEHVDVGEIQVGLGIEILVPQIAPADDGHAVVRQPQLVVHAPVLLRQVEQPAHGSRHAGAAAQMQRVEHADLDLRMRRQRGDDPVQAIAGGVVEQNAHAHATVGRLEQFLHQHPRADAVMNDVVLQIEAALGVADQLGAGGEGFGAVGQQAKAGAALMGRSLGLDRAAERRVAGGQRLARLARNVEVAQPPRNEASNRRASRGCLTLTWDRSDWRQVSAYGRWIPEKGQSVMLSVSASSLIAAAPTLRTASSICGVGLAA